LNINIEPFLNSQTQIGMVAVKSLRQSGATRQLPLPVTIGNSALCDITINSTSVEAFARIVYGNSDGTLRLADPTTGRHLPLSTLSHYGLAISGPFKHLPQNAVARATHKALAAESIWFATRSEATRRLLGGRFSQRDRLSLWGAATALGLLLISMMFGAPKSAPDLSRQPLPLSYASIEANGFGSIPSLRAYAKGLTFSVEIPADAVEKPHTFSFEAKGLEAHRELVVLINGKEFYATKPDANCLVTYCMHAALLPTGVLTAGTNEIYIQHQPVDSDYVVRNLMLALLSSPTPAEDVAIRQGLALARRGFEERGISHLNILAARRELDKIQALLSRRLGTEILQSETSVLSEKVDDELVRIREELWFNAQKDKHLGKFKSAKETLESLLELNPDASSSEHQKVRHQLDEIAELEK